MAKKVGGSPKAKKSKKNGAAPSSAGHNRLKPKDVQAFWDRLDRLHEEMATEVGKFMSDIKAVYDEAKDTLGVKAKIIRFEYGLHRAEEKRLAREAEFEADEKDALEELREALGGSLGAYAGKRAETMNEEAAD